MTMIKFYLHAIKTGFSTYMLLSIPIALILITISYWRTGYINRWKLLFTSLFSLYISVVYYLVMWPIPQNHVCLNTSEFYHPLWSYLNLKPFSFTFDFVSRIWANHSMRSILKAFLDMSFTILNIIMFIPLGMYVSYVFKLRIKHVLVIGLATSGLIEISQASGLFYIYNCQWRFFEVDDLITNTTGSMIGLYVMKFIQSKLHFKDISYLENEEKSKVDNKQASIFRIMFANIFDAGIMIMIFGGFIAVTSIQLTPVFIYIIYRLICLWFANNLHLGNLIMRVTTKSVDDKELNLVSKIKLSVYLILFGLIYFQEYNINFIAAYSLIILNIIYVIKYKSLHTILNFAKIETKVKIDEK